MNQREITKLSRIYNQLVEEFEAMSDLRLRPPQRSRMIEIVNEAVGSALHVTGMRCPKCDSTDITIVCGACALDTIKEMNQKARKAS